MKNKPLSLDFLNRPRLVESTEEKPITNATHEGRDAMTKLMENTIALYPPRP